MLNALLAWPKTLTLGLPITVVALGVIFGWHLIIWLIVVSILALPLWLAALWCVAFVAIARRDRMASHRDSP